MGKRYVAICPKCEMFKILEGRYEDYFCLHQKFVPIGFISEGQAIDDDSAHPFFEKIKCKIIEIAEDE